MNDNDPNDDSPDSGHGTHTAGTVAGDGTGGTLTGVAPGALLMAAKTWQADGAVPIERLIRIREAAGRQSVAASCRFQCGFEFSARTLAA